jgi:hypothetical protein
MTVRSIWMDQYYYVFGFLLLVFVILVVTCAEITIVLCYFQVGAASSRHCNTTRTPLTLLLRVLRCSSAPRTTDGGGDPS